MKWTKIIPPKVRDCIKEVIRYILMIICYPFRTPHDRAYIRWFLSKGEEKRYNYNLSKNSLVFDVGGYHGDFTAKITEKFGCSSYIFEPVKEYAQAIGRRFTSNKSIQVFSFGLSDHTSEEMMRLDDDGSSVHGQISTDIPTQEIQLKNVIEFMDDEKIDSIDLMKLNIEGGEYEVLKKLISSEYIKKVRYIQVQFHDIGSDSETKMKAIIEQLSSTHTIMWKCRPFIWESWELKN